MKIREQALDLRESTRELVRNLSLLDGDRASCCGVTLAQCHAIVEIGRMEKTSPSLLAERLRLERSTVTRVMDNLVVQGFVLRESDPGDRRALILSLTDKGHDFFISSENAMEEFYESILEKIPCNERSALASGIRTIAKAFEAKEWNCFRQVTIGEQKERASEQ
ncbi:MAG: hypothetical protein STSR0007_02000 [Thermovirga sp.]